MKSVLDMLFDGVSSVSGNAVDVANVRDWQKRGDPSGGLFGVKDGVKPGSLQDLQDKHYNFKRGEKESIDRDYQQYKKDIFEGYIYSSVKFSDYHKANEQDRLEKKWEGYEGNLAFLSENVASVKAGYKTNPVKIKKYSFAKKGDKF